MSKIFYRGVDIKTGEIVMGKSLINDEYGNIHIIKEISNHINWIMMCSVFPDTLAIHFPDMIDSQGNKIFASLQKDGKGGDIVELQASSGTCLSCGEKLSKTLSVAIYEQMEFKEIELNPHECFEKRESNYLLIGNIEYKKVIGIQE